MSKIYSVGDGIFEGTLQQFIDCFGTVQGVPEEDTIKAFCELEGWSVKVIEDE